MFGVDGTKHALMRAFNSHQHTMCVTPLNDIGTCGGVSGQAGVTDAPHTHVPQKRLLGGLSGQAGSECAP